MKYYVVADIHSFYSELETALKEKGFFEDTEPHKLIICGDLFDRGDESLKVQQFVIDLMEKDEVILIKGNHEDMLLEMVRNANRWFNLPDIEYSHHWHNRAVKTVLDLTGLNYFDLDNPAKVVKAIKDTPLFKKIIPAMKDYYETEHYIFVHGWIPCYEIDTRVFPKVLGYMDDWREAAVMEWDYARGYNGMLAWSQGIKEPNKTIVCGHWHCSWGHCNIDGKGTEFGKDADFTPFYGEGIIAIDTCTTLSRKVNCIVLED